MTAISMGKLLNLSRLAGPDGRFRMLAVDQRGSLRAALGRRAGKAEQDVTFLEMAKVKALLTKTLAPHATAVLTDPVYGLPYSALSLPARVGLLLAIEETGYEVEEEDFQERRTTLLEGWSVEKAKRAGANAVKLLVYYRPDLSPETKAHQERIVREVGEACVASDLPFVLEVVSYPLEEGSTDSPAYARRKPQLVIANAREFSRPEYRVDLLKLEFPADLKYTEEFCRKVFDGKDREPVYALEQVREFCRELDAAAALPWVILSAGVGIREFLVQVELACEAGASGFLCGRAIWQDALERYPDLTAMEKFLCEEGVYNFERANAASMRAVPWFAHRRFSGGIVPAGIGPDWYRTYS